MPDFELVNLLAFAAAALALYLTPGADMMFISASGAAGGRRVGIAAGLGVSIGSLFHTVLAVIGVAALIRANPNLYDMLRYAGAAYLVWLAIQAWRAPPPNPAADGAMPGGRAFWRGAVTNILNPKVSVFVLAFLPQFTSTEAGPIWIQLAILGTVFSLGSIPFNCSYGLLAGLFAERLRRFGRDMNRVSAVVFGGLAARLAVN